LGPLSWGEKLKKMDKTCDEVESPVEEKIYLRIKIKPGNGARVFVPKG